MQFKYGDIIKLKDTAKPVEQLDLGPNGKEEFDVWIKIGVTLTKDQLFELLKVANSQTNYELGGEEEIPARVTIETFPKKEDLENYH